MLIGLLADSHGRAATTSRAIAALRREGAELLLHLGDVETEAVIDELIGHNCRLVLGNCDWDERNLSSYARHMGIAVDHPCGSLVVSGKSIVFTHGHLGKHMDEAVRSGVDYLVHGHTHEPRDERVGMTRIINPGALFRAPRYTVALLNPVEDIVRFVDIGKGD